MSVDESQREEIAQAGRRYRMDFASYLPPVRAPSGSAALTGRGRKRRKGKKSGRRSGKNDASKRDAYDFSLSGNNIKLPPIGKHSILFYSIPFYSIHKGYPTDIFSGLVRMKYGIMGNPCNNNK